MTGRRRKTAPAPECTPEQLQMVLKMRRSGATFDEIATATDLPSPDAVRGVFDAAMAGVDTGFDRALEISRLDALLAALFPAAQAGDVVAADKVLVISQRRERLAGMPIRSTNRRHLAKAYDRTVKASRQLVDGLDDALIESGRAIARRVDEAEATGDPDQITKALYLLPHLNNALVSMLATPKARRDAGVEDQKPQSGKSAKVTQMKEAARRLGQVG